MWTASPIREVISGEMVRAAASNKHVQDHHAAHRMPTHENGEAQRPLGRTSTRRHRDERLGPDVAIYFAVDDTNGWAMDGEEDAAGRPLDSSFPPARRTSVLRS